MNQAQAAPTRSTGFRVPPSTARLLLFGAFFLSGANGLVFEIVFRRLLHLSLGITHYSVGTVITVFMAGLGIGSIAFGRLADRRRPLLLIYGLLEAGIGVLCLCLMGLQENLDSLYVALGSLPGSGADLAVKTLLAGLFLLPVTVLMGGTLPVLGKAMTGPRFPPRLPGYGRTLGLLYGLNTLGGVAGTVGAAFYVLGELGTSLTILVFSLVNVLIGLTAVGLHLLSPQAPGGEEPPVQKTPARSDLPAGRRTVPAPEAPPGVPPAGAAVGEPVPSPGLLLAVFAVSGFVGMSVEAYWTRVLAYVVGSHGYAFGVILAAFLSGIGLGSVLFSRVVDRIRRKTAALSLVYVGMAAGVLITSLVLYQVRGLAGWLTLRSGGSWERFLFFQAALLFLMLSLPILLMGAVFPFIMSLGAGSYRRMGSFIGRAYFANTMGSIGGAFLGSFLLLHYLGVSMSLKLSILLALAAALLLAATGRPLRGQFISRATACAVVAAVVLLLPLGAPLQRLDPQERLIHYEEAASATVSVRENAEGNRMLSINGLDEVPVDPSSLLTFRVLAHLPLLAHPHPEHVMVLSLGGGITTGSVCTHPVASVDAVELCPPVVRAAELFERWNRGVLGDPRLEITIQDGRNYLLLPGPSYDVITADATHPWSADSWILYTTEFYRLVRSRLTTEGIFCQWVPLHWLSETDFRCILRTMAAVFPDLSLWYTGSYAVVLARESDAPIDPSRLARGMMIPAVSRDLSEVGVRSPELLLSLFLLSDRGIREYAGEGPLNTDDHPFLEHSAARCFGIETTPLNLSALADVREHPRMILAPAVTGAPASFNPGLQDANPGGGVSHDALDRLYRARELMISGRIATYRGDFAGSVDRYRRALEEAPEDGISALFLEDAEHTWAAAVAGRGDELRRSGDHERARAAYLRALRIDPAGPRAHNGMGLLLYAAGAYERALEHYDLALRETPYQVQIRFNKVLALLKLGLVERAEEEIRVIAGLEERMQGSRLAPELRTYLSQVRRP
ncbi:MAG: fused MFS/spermidine synthase [Spirochaetota bacterium]